MVRKLRTAGLSEARVPDLELLEPHSRSVQSARACATSPLRASEMSWLRAPRMIFLHCSSLYRFSPDPHPTDRAPRLGQPAQLPIRHSPRWLVCVVESCSFIIPFVCKLSSKVRIIRNGRNLSAAKQCEKCLESLFALHYTSLAQLIQFSLCKTSPSQHSSAYAHR